MKIGGYFPLWFEVNYQTDNSKGEDLKKKFVKWFNADTEALKIQRERNKGKK